jgi:hypothetical protein
MRCLKIIAHFICLALFVFSGFLADSKYKFADRFVRVTN